MCSVQARLTCFRARSNLTVLKCNILWTRNNHKDCSHAARLSTLYFLPAASLMPDAITWQFFITFDYHVQLYLLQLSTHFTLLFSDSLLSSCLTQWCTTVLHLIFCVCVCDFCVHVHVWRSWENMGILSHQFLSYSFETGSLADWS